MQSITFRDLFDHIGSQRMTFSKRAELLSGQEVELRGYLAAMHADPRQITLAGEAGVCPDCADKPVAYVHLPGFVPGAGLFSPQAVRLTGSLSYGFAIVAEGYATFLRLENASVATGLRPGLLAGKRG
ncbi:MAG: hypothetical protein D4R74_02895 [Betaproteobacteria bacterium]|nr:MAG: hypothetical protein D4R74_02895 [Betaproteobacteria bacterium]